MGFGIRLVHCSVPEVIPTTYEQRTMSTIHMVRNHTMGREGARRAVQDIAGQIRNKLDVDYRWDGDILKFSRPGADGSIAVTDDTVTIDVDLGIMYGAFKDPIEQQIGTYLQQKFGQ